jgi:hypothetical protein
MGLLNKTKTSETEEILELSSEELNFLKQAMRSAVYKGYEFEMFYTIWAKLVEFEKNIQQ